MKKTLIVLSPSFKRKPKRGKKGRKLAVAGNGVFRERERERLLSRFLDDPTVEILRAKKETILRGEDNAWAPILRSFDKLREVGVSSYLSFTLCLSVFMMFELIEAVRGRSICPKSWDRNVRIFGTQFVQFVTVHGLFGLLIV